MAKPASYWRAAAAGLAAALGLGGYAQAQPRTAPPPAAWIAYGERTAQAIAAWLDEDTPPAVRLRGHLLAAPAAAEQGVALELKVWIAPDGVVSRVDFAPLGDAAADADLSAIVSGRTLAAPPPKMIQPLRLVVDIKARPAPHTTQF
ncbi:hypothetical protein CFHF_05090 [Caulobacter flavus]|uniref:TonB C-terminal domain-containing protein n=1 Tax=Caulobacter flavus TaxID=1679497 RepID=A0A2N5CXG2_9CAUL|nr:hypothetical protein [Caulobacter flavus]AYV47981.1 hypothetical protein C1707_17900 [Caulobacter flavus]PLR18456.1 hypothetical protein CFHF_05090 [Caulobacter flavus]